MLRLLGVHPGPDITVPAAASLARQPSAEARQALDELVSANLITEHAPGRYAFHDLLRAYAAEQARSTDSDDSRRAALVRVFDHYLHTANAASMLLTPYRDPIALDPPRPQSQPEEFTSRQQAMEWLQAERQVLLSVINCAADDGFGKHAWQLAWAVAMFFNWYGYLPELMATQEIALAAAARLGDQAGQAEAHRYLGVAQARLGCYAEANEHLTELLTLGQLAGDVVVQARAHLDLGHVCMLQGGKSRDALSHVEQSLRLYQVSGHRSGQGTALNAACWLSTEIGQGLEALEYGAQALAIHRELEDRINEAATLDTLGCAHKLLGNHAEAIVCYQQAVDVYGNLTDRHDLAEVLIHLGDAQQAVGQAGAARRAWRRALAILDDMKHPDAEAARSRLKPGPRHNGNRPG
jgi:tetratricopeptide (TPR) repeat protein